MVENDVYIVRTDMKGYPASPYDPPEIYPEFKQSAGNIDKTNFIYSGIRTILFHLGFDRDNYGTASWNPFKNFIKKGDKVVLKPNFVKGNHPLGLEGVLSMITHASVMRPVIDYILLATGGDCQIMIVDVPLQSSDWKEIIQHSGTEALIKYYAAQNIEVALVDLRREIAIFNEENVIIAKEKVKFRKDEDYIAVDLGVDSALAEISQFSDRLEITDYGYGTVPQHHNSLKNEYLIPREILEANCIINLPKLKTHRKAGITCAMKNLIGINGDKSWIAHHRRGLKKNGGDEFEKFVPSVVIRERIWNYLKTKKWGVRLATLLKKIFRKMVWKGQSYEEKSMHDNTAKYREGSWHGNDTIWRCIRDLNQILFYADKKGKMTTVRQRNYCCIVDGIMAAEKEGPMEHLPKKTGILFGGKNPVEVDFAAAEIMGFDYKKIPSIFHSFELKKYPLTSKNPANVKISANVCATDYRYKFLTPAGWKNIYDTFSDI
jgi:uncharacterized protein (DUF362 family)